MRVMEGNTTQETLGGECAADENGSCCMSMPITDGEGHTEEEGLSDIVCGPYQVVVMATNDAGSSDPGEYHMHIAGKWR